MSYNKYERVSHCPQGQGQIFRMLYYAVRDQAPALPVTSCSLLSASYFRFWLIELLMTYPYTDPILSGTSSVPRTVIPCTVTFARAISSLHQPPPSGFAKYSFMGSISEWRFRYWGQRKIREDHEGDGSLGFWGALGSWNLSTKKAEGDER